MNHGSLHLDVVVSPEYGQNCYIAWSDVSPKCILVDPGFDVVAILGRLDKLERPLEAIVLTHGHVDHIAGNRAMKIAHPNAPIVIGAGDAPMLTDPALNLSEMAGRPIVSPPADKLVKEGDEVQFVGLTWIVREIPGHSPGHVVYIAKDIIPPVVFGGDVLFAGSVGRSDFPGGNGRQLVRGIREKLYTLPLATVVYPGHGPSTFIGEEKRSNPFTVSTSYG
ncbi:MAG: MBL fold metallo-hydrolase [Planctomycetia bacterium]